MRVYVQLGRERSAAQQYEQANAMYAAVLRLDPENAEAKEIITMIEAGGGAPLNVVTRRPNRLRPPRSRVKAAIFMAGSDASD
jgi:hypothetical protein